MSRLLLPRWSATDLPPTASDDDLLAWSGALVALQAGSRARVRAVPLRATRPVAPRIRIARVEPPASRRTLRLRPR